MTSSNSSGSVSDQLSRKAAQSVNGRGRERGNACRSVIRILGVAEPLVRDADPAHERRVLVDDHDFAVRAMVHLVEAKSGAAAGTSEQGRRPPEQADQGF
jgi:hypothetical protein